MKTPQRRSIVIFRGCNYHAKHAYKVTNEDLAAARASGLSEDQIFEIVVCGAIGQATRQYDTARGPRGRDREGLSMRLAILDSDHGFGTKALFAFIGVVTRQPVVDAVKLVLYRPDFYGTRMKELTHEAMRGPSAWSVGDRELMAAFVSTVNECAFCIKAHAVIAARAYHDDARVLAALSDLETAPVEEPLLATLRLLRKLTREHAVDADDMRAVLAAGCLAPADRGRARRLLRVQHDRSARRYVRVLRAGA